MISMIEENIVYLELLRRGYSVTVGRAPNGGEVDFVAEKNGKKIYVQVTHTISSYETEKREYSSLGSIKDNYPKYIVTSEGSWPSDYEGIIEIGLADFLMSDAF